MKHSKINIDRGPLSAEQIAAGQDFGKVLKAFSKTPLPWYKTKVFVGAAVTLVAASVIVAGIFYFQNSGTSIENMDMNSFVIEGPCEGVNIPFSSNSVDAQDGGVIEIDGSTITIPPDAFVFCDGGEVSGDVEIDFRDFHDNVDVLLSGIPMKYDSLGTEFNFETAGMFELRGKQDSKELCIKEGKSIGVDLKSTYGNGFNNYRLNTATGDWTYLEPSPAVITECEPEVIRYPVREYEFEELSANRNPQPMLASVAQAFAQAGEVDEVASECPLGPASSSPCVTRTGIGWEVHSRHIDDKIMRSVFNECFARTMDRKKLGLSIDLTPASRSTVECVFEVGGEEMYRTTTLIQTDSLGLHVSAGIQTILSRLNVREEMQADFANLESSKPVMPKVAAKSGYQLELDFDAQQFPELAVYDDMLFEVDESKTAFDPSKANEPWTSMDVSKGDVAGSYVLVFSRRGESYAVDCYPVVEGKDEANAQRIFDDKLKQYQIKKAELEAEALKREQEEIRRIEEERKRHAEMMKNRKEHQAQVSQATQATGVVTRAFTVESFGIYNCDRPFRFKPIQTMVVTYIDETGGRLSHADVYLANLNADALVNHRQGEEINFNPNEEYMLWTIVDGDKLAVIDAETFDEAKSRKECEFEPVVLSEKIKSADQVRSLLHEYMN